MNKPTKYPEKPKIGDIVVCIDDDSEDLDIGMSGLVSKGRRDLKKGEQYNIIEIPYDSDRHVPPNKCRFGGKQWSDDDYTAIRWGWHRVYLEGVSESVFLNYFEPINNNEQTKS
jgi:hypothetical protein